MKKETEYEIRIALSMLKKVMVKDGVGVCVLQNGDMAFFDAKTYVEKDEFDGFKINLEQLVKE